MAYRYTMVTGFEDHWDKIPNGEASHPYRMLRGDTTGDFLENGTPTVFVKLDGSGKVIRAWSGKVDEIREVNSYIKFKVKLESSVENFAQYSEFKRGWYIDRIVDDYPETEEVTSRVSDLQPPMFENLLGTKSWTEFEDCTYYLFRLLGIHSVYKIDRNRQAGRADGFFKLKGSAVIYDCTLEQEEKEEKKSQQIYNYCKQLESGVIELEGKEGKEVQDFHGLEKQVWLITRSSSRIIKRVNDIAVKEINVSNLIDIYEYRLRKMITERDLEKQLMAIGQSVGL